MFSLIRTLSLRQVQRHPARLGLMVTSVALGVAAWTTTQVLDRTLSAALRSSASPLAADADFHVGHGDVGLPHALAARLAALPGVASVRPLLVRRVLVTRPVRCSAVLLGIDLAAERERGERVGLKLRGGSPADFARAVLAGRAPVVVGEALAAALPRDARTIDILAAGTPQRLIEVGVVEARGEWASLGGHVLLTDVRTAGRILGDPDRVTRFDVSLAPEAAREDVRAALTVETAGAAEVLSPEAQDARVQDALESLRIAFSLCGAGALVLALLLTTGAFSVGVTERGTEIGLLRALGAERFHVVRLFVTEACALGLAGSMLGLPLGWALARLTCGPMLRVFGDVFVPLDARAPDIGVSTCLSGIAAGVATTLVAAVVPIARVSLRAPLAALAKVPGQERGWGSPLCVAGAVVTLAVAGLCFAEGDRVGSRFRAYATLVALLTSAALVIPAVTSLIGRVLRPLAETSLGPPGRLAADRLVRHPAGSGVAVASLAGGVALILQTGGVIHGNEEAIRGWVDTCIAGDLFVTSGGPLSASGQTLPMREDVRSQVEAFVPGAHAVAMTFRYVPWTRAGRETRIMVLALDPRRYCEANRGRRPPLADLDKYRRLDEPATAIVSENFASLYGVAQGDTIELPGATGSVRLRVVGTVVDFSCNRGLVMVDRTQQGAEFGVSGVDVFSVTAPPGADSDQLARSISQAPWAADQALVVVPRRALRAHILGMVGRLYGVAYVQEVTAAVVAALGVGMALLISVLQRRRELGLLRAVGATPSQAVRVVLAEAGLMAVVGIAFGLAIGTALEWYVLRVVLLEETGFLFPVRFPWACALAVAFLAGAGALLAALGPALQTARQSITEAIAYE